jgi:hypothetical protein
MIETIALIATAILVCLAIFQLSAAFGAPIGHFTLGGQHKVLPLKLRIASFLSILIDALFAFFILSKAGVIESFLPTEVLTVGMWIFTFYFALGVVMNAISRSKAERFVMTPLALIVGILFFIVTIA